MFSTLHVKLRLKTKHQHDKKVDFKVEMGLFGVDAK